MANVAYRCGDCGSGGVIDGPPIKVRTCPECGGEYRPLPTDVERYECTRCDGRTFYVVTDDTGVSFFRCVKCDRTVPPNHRSLTA